MLTKSIFMKTMVLLGVMALLFPAQAFAKVTTSWSQQGGTSISGWYWLRDARDSATWTVRHDSRSLPGDLKCELWIDALVTQTASGGSGHDKTIDLRLRSGRLTRDISFLLKNDAPLGMQNSRGAGYQIKKRIISDPPRGRSDIRLSSSDLKDFRDVCSEFKSTRQLVITYKWTPTQEACCQNNKRYTHHVAVNKNTMQWSFYQ